MWLLLALLIILLVLAIILNYHNCNYSEVVSCPCSVSAECECAGMGGTNSRGRAFAAMNEEQALTPTTPRREIVQPWSLAANSADHSSPGEDKPEDSTCKSVSDGE